MSWKYLRIIVIVLLLAANVLLFAAVYTDYVNKNYYNENDIYELCSLLASSGVELEYDVFPKRRVDPNVYFTKYDDEDIKLALSVLSGADVSENDGEYISFSNGGKYTVFGDLSFEFEADGYKPQSYVSSIYESKTVKKVQRICEKFLRVKKIARAFGSSARVSLEYRADNVFVDGREVYYTTVYEYIDGMKTSNSVDIAVYDGDVIYAKGTFSIIPPTRVYSADTLDVMTFLVFEKRYFENGITPKTVAVDGISCEYRRYTDMFGALYFMPVCGISYSSGDLRTYDMITGLVIFE